MLGLDHEYLPSRIILFQTVSFCLSISVSVLFWPRIGQRITDLKFCYHVIIFHLQKGKSFKFEGKGQSSEYHRNKVLKKQTRLYKY